MNDNPSYESIKKYIGEALLSFVNDPPDSDFQEGYQAALFVVAVEALGLEYPDTDVRDVEKPRQVDYLKLVKNEG